MWYHIQAERISFTCKVKVNANNNRVIGLVKGSLAVNIKAEPVAGAANLALLKLLAEFFRLTSAEVQLLRGRKSRLKLVAVPNHPHLLAQLASF